jgi:multidrug efflux pump subunit AcrA (membrane-fusion protein)
MWTAFDFRLLADTLMSRPSTSALVLSTVCFAFGGLLGIAIPSDGARSAILELWRRGHPLEPSNAGVDPSAHDEHEEGEHVDVSKTARQSLGLTIASAELSDYVGVTPVPAYIIEQSAVSDLSVASQVEGIVAAVHALAGEAVRERQKLFAIRLTGDALASAQTDLLNTMQQIAIVEEEIARLAPLAKSGAITGTSKLEREYERRRLLARKDTKQQELLVRGLTRAQVDQIINTGELVTMVEVAVPEGLVPDAVETDSASVDPWNFTIEKLHVTPGTLVKVGDPLCNLAYHAELYVAGQAFARDLKHLEELMIARRPVSAEFDDSDDPNRVNDLIVTYIDNHVDEETGTYGFYLPLKNKVVHDFVDAAGRRFRQWRFKPGARGHVRLPTQSFRSQFVLPREAVVVDGLDHYVFVEQHHDDHSFAYEPNHAYEPDHADEPDHEEETIDFIPVAVRVMYEDRRVRVVSADGDLHPGDRIAMNHAHTLLMAMRASDDAGHHHHHDH